jgi:hypothetical protein
MYNGVERLRARQPGPGEISQFRLLICAGPAPEFRAVESDRSLQSDIIDV